MEKETTPAGWRAWLPGVFLVVSITLSVVLSGERVSALFGPSDAERAQKKQEFLTNRTKLSLQLAKCQRDKTKVDDAYICGGSSVVYRSLASSADCLLAKEAAEELGITARDLMIPRSLTPASSGTRTGT